MKALASIFPVFHQAIRYGVVGVLNNLFGYLIYLLITYLWLDPKVAISILYPVGALTAYFGHSKYAFSYQGRNAIALMRYGFAHFVGYSTNLLMLFILSDMLQFPHQAVQALAILVVAGILFIMFKYFVFPKPESYNKSCE